MTELELDDYLRTSDTLRGAIISHTVLLERNIDLYICQYFCPDQNKMYELMELIVSERMEFSKKAQAFVQILKKRCAENKKEFEKEYPKMNANFQLIAEARNAFAHKFSTIPTDDDVKKYVIILREFLNTTTNKPYTYEDIDNILGRIEHYSQLVKSLNNPQDSS